MTSPAVNLVLDKVLEELKHKNSLEIFELFYERSETFRKICNELVSKEN